MDGGSPRGFVHFLIADNAFDAVNDILADGAGEEERLLFDDADLLAQVMDGIVIDIASIQVHSAGGDIIKARQQVHQGGLARPGGAQQGYRLAGCTFKAHIAQDGIILFVFKGDILKF